MSYDRQLCLSACVCSHLDQIIWHVTRCPAKRIPVSFHLKLWLRKNTAFLRTKSTCKLSDSRWNHHRKVQFEWMSDKVKGHNLELSHKVLTPVTGWTFTSVPLVDQGPHIPPRYLPPRGQGRRPSATPGIGPTPCGAASLHSHMESRGFHFLQTGLRLSAPETEQGRQEKEKWCRYLAEMWTKAHWYVYNNRGRVQIINRNKLS